MPLLGTGLGLGCGAPEELASVPAAMGSIRSNREIPAWLGSLEDSSGSSPVVDADGLDVRSRRNDGRGVRWGKAARSAAIDGARRSNRCR